jgi:hypothetical protein
MYTTMTFVIETFVCTGEVVIRFSEGGWGEAVAYGAYRVIRPADTAMLPVCLSLARSLRAKSGEAKGNQNQAFNIGTKLVIT